MCPQEGLGDSLEKTDAVRGWGQEEKGIQSLENTVISLGELRENRESGGEPAAKRREERPPAASGTR